MNRPFVTLAIALLAIALLVSACGQSADDAELAPYASRYKPLASETTLITGATILTGAGDRLGTHWAFAAERGRIRASALELARVEEGSATSRRLFITNGRESMSVGIVKQSSANTVDVLAAVREEIEAGLLMPNIPQMGVFWSAMESALSTITSGRATPQEALDNAARRMKRKTQ